jgi:hypothetical protein
MPKASEVLTPAEAPSASQALQTGNAALTAKLRNEYGKANIEAQVNGDPPPKWAEWLAGNGYGLDSRGLAYKVSK